MNSCRLTGLWFLLFAVLTLDTATAAQCAHYDFRGQKYSKARKTLLGDGWNTVYDYGRDDSIYREIGCIIAGPCWAEFYKNSKIDTCYIALQVERRNGVWFVNSQETD